MSDKRRHGYVKHPGAADGYGPIPTPEPEPPYEAGEGPDLDADKDYEQAPGEGVQPESARSRAARDRSGRRIRDLSGRYR